MKIFVFFVLFSFLFISCGSDGVESIFSQSTSLEITEVDPVNNIIEIYNGTNESIDISNYWLCSRISYESLSGVTLVTGSLVLDAGQRVTLKTNSLDLDDTSADLGLYSTNTFANSDSMVDFIQWGAGGLGRESVAVAKGIWTTGDFISISSNMNRSMTKVSFGDSSSNWASSLKTFGGQNASGSDIGFAVGGGELVVSEVDPINNVIEIYNGTGTSVDLSGYWFCSRISYEALNASSLISGSLVVPDKGYVVLQLSSLNLDSVSADLGLYSTNSFASAAAMVDFVQWGAGGLGRESVAVSKGIWTAGDFVSSPSEVASVSRITSGGQASSWNVFGHTLGSSADTN